MCIRDRCTCGGRRVLEHVAEVRRDGREGPEPATCSKRDGYEMALPSSGESVGGGEADGQRRARWAACTRGVRASAVMLHGIPAGVHAPGGRARSAGGAVDEPRAATQQHAADRRPPPCPRRLGAVTPLADGTAALNLRRAQPFLIRGSGLPSLVASAAGARSSDSPRASPRRREHRHAK